MMKNVLFRVLVLIGLSGIAATAVAQTVRLKVITINMRMSGELVDYDITPFCEFIAQENPDFVALQEVDHFTSRNKNQDVITLMGERLGMFPLFGRAMAYASGSYGVGILSKYPFMRSKTFVSNTGGSKEPRACTFIDIKLPNGKEVRLGVTHLDTAGSQAQISLVGAIVQKMNTDNLPNLLLGDFNAVPGSDTMNYATLFWDDLSAESGHTIPYSKPISRIDYIMGYPRGAWNTVSVRAVTSGIHFSDHCPVIAELELK